MNLIKTIIFIGLGMLLVNCGGQDNSANKVRVAAVEGGVPKTEDGRIMLSSESETNRLVIPNGYFEGSVLDKHKLEQAIADKFDAILKVYDLVTFEKFSDFMNEIDFHISFTMETVQHLDDEKIFNQKIFENMQCAVTFHPYSYRMDLHDCGNDLIALKRSPYETVSARIHLNTTERNIFIKMVKP